MGVVTLMETVRKSGHEKGHTMVAPFKRTKPSTHTANRNPFPNNRYYYSMCYVITPLLFDKRIKKTPSHLRARELKEHTTMN